MSDLIGVYIPDLLLAPRLWREWAIANKPARRLALSDRRGLYAIEWANEQATATAQIGYEGHILIVIQGAVRMRPDLPCHGELATYVAQALAAGRFPEEILAELDGEFVIFGWDGASKTAFLATDPVGNHCIYYVAQAAGLIWASDPWRVARLLGTPQIDREALNLYFDLKGVPAPWTLLAGVRKVRPGHVLYVTEEGCIEREYWSLVQRALRQYTGDLGAARDDLLTLFASTIQRYVGDVNEPVGVLLSGGLDSAALLAMARRVGTPARAFSIGYAPAYHGDETDLASDTATKLGTPIDVCHFAPHDAATLAREVLPNLAEPVADPTLLPLIFLARHARERVSTLLDGTGSDVIFAGTTKYSAEHYVRIYQRIPRLLRQGLIEPAVRALPSSRRWQVTSMARRWQQFLTMEALPEVERHVSWTRFASRPVVARMLPAERLTSDDLGSAYLRSHRQELASDDITATTYMTLRCHTPWVDLLKLQSLEQQAGVSVRKPFLSPQLIEFALGLPGHFKVAGQQGKLVLRQACEGLLPAGVLRRRKAIFATPISAWLEGELRDLFWETISQPTGLINVPGIQRMARENQLGWRDWQSELWAAFVLQRWWVSHYENTQ